MQRTGGVVGREPPRHVDLASLPAGQQHTLEALVRRASLDTADPSYKKPRVNPWDFEYRLTVEDGGSTHTVLLQKDAAPEPLRLLVEELEQLDLD
jgi:hypothetical protein